MTLSLFPSDPTVRPALPKLAPLRAESSALDVDADRPRAASAGVAKSLPVSAQSVHLGDYIRMMAEQAPDLAKDEDYALVYDGERLVGRIHNSGAAALFGVDAPEDWAKDASGQQGPAEAQRRADQFASIGYVIRRAETAASEDTWRPPAPLYDPAGFEAYARARDAAAPRRP